MSGMIKKQVHICGVASSYSRLQQHILTISQIHIFFGIAFSKVQIVQNLVRLRDPGDVKDKQKVMEFENTIVQLEV